VAKAAEQVALNIAVRLKEGVAVEEGTAHLRASLQQASLPVVVMDWHEASGALGAVADTLALILYGALFVFAILGTLVVGNALVLSMFARIRELAVLRAMGAGPAHVVGIFLAEGVFLGLFASIIGIAGGAALVALLATSGIPAIAPNFTVAFGGPALYPSLSALSVALAPLVTVAICLVAAIVPTWFAVRVPPVAAMQARE
jgi:putative ABC transport system permease protein